MDELAGIVTKFLLLLHLITSTGVVAPRQHCQYLQVGDGNCELCRKQASCTYVKIIPELPEDIKILHLDNNKISELKRTSFSHVNYKKIHLANNSISSVAEDTFLNLNHLQVLDLSNNRITFLDENIFQHNTELNILSLQDNPDLNFSLNGLPQSLEKLDVQNTSTVISLNALKKLKHLHSYKGNLCLDDNCSANVHLEGTLCSQVTHIPEACVKETDETVPENSAESTDTDSNYINIKKLLNDHTNALRDLSANVDDINELISRIENDDNFDKINMSLTNFHIEVGNDIRKINNQCYNITTQINKMTGLLNFNELHDFTWLYTLMAIVIIVLQISTVALLYCVLSKQGKNHGKEDVLISNGNVDF